MKRLNPNTNSFFKRGDLDSNGNSFWCYQKNIIENGYFRELWISKEKIVLYEENLINGYKKICTKCNREFVAKDNFYKKFSSKDGFDPWCKECFLNKNRRWVKENRDYHLKLTESWYERNKEKHLSNSKRIYNLNKPRKLLDYYRREKRTSQATPLWVDKKDLLKIYKEAKKIRDETGIKYEVDHIIPLVHDQICGLNVPWNLQIIPEEENRKKANKIDLDLLNKKNTAN